MKQTLLFFTIFFSLSNIYGVCISSRMTRPILTETLCTLTTCCVELKNSITSSCDLNPVFTTLQDLNNTLTTCCTDLKNTITNLDFDVTVSCDFSPIFTTLQNLDNTLTTCCADLKNTITNLNVNVALTLTVVGPCEFTPITAAQVISTPGTFCLANDIVGTITIDADNVVLDLNGKEISGGLNGVVITSTHQCITVENGFIKNTSQEGILADSGSEIILKSLVVVNCGSDSNPFGIRFDNSQNCIIYECLVARGFGGIALATTSYSFVQNCQVLTCTQATVAVDAYLSSGLANQFDNCAVVNFESTGAVNGFNIAAAGDETILTNCSARIVNGGSVATGFNINGACCVLDACIVSDFDANSVELFDIVGNRNIIKNCIAQCSDATDVLRGFHIRGGRSIIEACQALDLVCDGLAGAIGYFLDGGTDGTIIKESIALRIRGMVIGHGFAGTVITASLITECEANSCEGSGFSFSGLTNSIMNSIALSNGTNFDIGGTTSALAVAPGAGITAGANIAVL